jgi:hypothetical protein
MVSIRVLRNIVQVGNIDQAEKVQIYNGIQLDNEVKVGIRTYSPDAKFR